MDSLDALALTRRTLESDLRLVYEGLMALRRPERNGNPPLLHVVDDHLERVHDSLHALLLAIAPDNID